MAEEKTIWSGSPSQVLNIPAFLVCGLLFWPSAAANSSGSRSARTSRPAASGGAFVRSTCPRRRA